ncbi:MAG: PIN domain-containing protein [Steroidobacteraceae bacterium]
MTVQCFVDANILVHYVDPSEPLKQELAAVLIKRLWVEQRARTSIQALNEFYTVVRCKLSHVVAPGKAWAHMEDLLQWEPQPVDAAVVREARAIELRYKLNWWDSLILAAAQQQHCTVLYSEDFQHGATLGGVKVVNPFIAQVQEEPAPYAAQLISPHRPRGRPRKHATV